MVMIWVTSHLSYAEEWVLWAPLASCRQSYLKFQLYLDLVSILASILSASANTSAGTKSLVSAARSAAAMISALEKEKTTSTVIDLEKRKDIGQLLLSALHLNLTQACEHDCMTRTETLLVFWAQICLAMPLISLSACKRTRWWTKRLTADIELMRNGQACLFDFSSWLS